MARCRWCYNEMRGFGPSCRKVCAACYAIIGERLYELFFGQK